MSKIGPKEAQLRDLKKQQATEAVCKIDHSAEASIPKELCRTCNPKPLTASVSVTTTTKEEKRDFRIPKGMSTEEGNKMLAARAASKKEKDIANLQRMKAEHEAKGEFYDTKLKAWLPLAAKGNPLKKAKGAATTADANAPAQSEPMKGDTMSHAVAKKTETKKHTTTARKPAKAAKKANENARKRVSDGEPQGKAADICKLASRPNGASREELIKLTGWKQQAWKWYFHNSKGNGFCQRFPYTLKVIEGKDGESRYKITKKS